MNFEQDRHKFGETGKDLKQDLKKAVVKASHSNQKSARSHGQWSTCSVAREWKSQGVTSLHKQ